MVQSIILTASSPREAGRPAGTSAAGSLGPESRRELAVKVLSGQESVSQTARDYEVSRKFVGQQTVKARQAIDQAFTPPPDQPDDLLFYLPVTKSWIEQATLGLMLICHSSLRGVSEFFRDLFDYSMAHTTAHNIFRNAVTKARTHNATVDLSRVRIGAHDEIFQHGQPVLVGCDVNSTFCYLLSAEQHRDADTWGLHLLELADRGFAPDATIADFGGGLRAGQKQALPDVPCRGDVFHALKDLGDVANTLENQALRAIEEHRKCQSKQTQHSWRHGCKDRSLAHRLGQAARHELDAVALADEVNLLAEWLRHDILAVAGPCHDDRCRLYDFIVAELRQRIERAGPALKKVCTTLANHRDDLLAFAVQLDCEIAELAAAFQVEPDLVRELLHHQVANPKRPEYWQREAELHRRAHGQLHELQLAVRQLRERKVRASSVVENLNGRLRGYFFLRRQLGPEYLDVLQFFLNHRRFVRSERPERRDKSPRELLTGEDQPHWLELLGYQRFEQN